MLKQRYTKSFLEDLNFVPEVVIDAMFLLNTNPRRNTKTIGLYSEQLFERYVKTYLRKGATEVHLVFDSPQVGVFNPKVAEQARRDGEKNLPKTYQQGTLTLNTVTITTLGTGFAL